MIETDAGARMTWVFDLPEAEAAGLEEGLFDLLALRLSAEDLARTVFGDGERARAFLAGDIDAAKGQAPHWEEMLAGRFADGGPPPVLVAHEDGSLEVVDGMHRLAGYAANGESGDAEAILAVPPGSDPPAALGGAIVLARFRAEEVPRP